MKVYIVVSGEANYGDRVEKVFRHREDAYDCIRSLLEKKKQGWKRQEDCDVWTWRSDYIEIQEHDVLP